MFPSAYPYKMSSSLKPSSFLFSHPHSFLHRTKRRQSPRRHTNIFIIKIVNFNNEAVKRGERFSSSCQLFRNKKTNTYNKIYKLRQDSKYCDKEATVIIIIV